MTETVQEGKSMKQKIQLTDYAQMITEALPRGILLNTNGDKFNSMVIGWGALGTCWGEPTFTVYVREGRYTKAQLDKTDEFTVSIPLEKPIPLITRVCGTQSGRDVDKSGILTLEEPEVINTPGVREYPLTLECMVLYSQEQDLSRLPDDILEEMYPSEVPGTDPMANRDAHTAYIGKIVAAYMIL